MPFVLIAIAVLLIVVGFNGCYSQFFQLLKGDFTGSQSFFIWIGALLVIGFVGYIPKMKGLSEGFLLLVLLAFTLSNRGVFDPNNGFFAQIKG